MAKNEALEEQRRAKRRLRSAAKYGTKDKLLQKVTKDAIEKAGEKGDVEAKCRAVDNAAALDDVEEQRRDAAAAGEDLSTADAEAAFLVAQEGGEDAQEVQQRASDYLNQRDQGLSVGAALEVVAAAPSTEPIGLNFGEST